MKKITKESLKKNQLGPRDAGVWGVRIGIVRCVGFQNMYTQKRSSRKLKWDREMQVCRVREYRYSQVCQVSEYVHTQTFLMKTQMGPRDAGV